MTSQPSGPTSGSPEPAPEASLATSAANRAVGVRTLRPAIGLGVLALVSLIVFALNASGQSVDFRFSNDGDAIRLPDVSVPSAPYGWVVTIVLAALAVYAAVQARKLPRWAVIVAGFFFVTGFLVWIV
ncbi:UNVERIFIED_CONTAM: ABC transporter permease, partial [Acinetobacter sp. HSTU-ASm16]